MQTKPLLIEIGTEELPPKDLLALSNSFTEIFSDLLKQEQLIFDNIETFATPRRLALRVNSLVTQQPARTTYRKGPAKEIAYDNSGAPTQAALGFAKSCGVSLATLKLEDTSKGSFLYFEENIPGKETTELIPELLEKALSQLPIPKRMRWSNYKYNFVRPVHWVLLLFDNEVISANIFGKSASTNSYGHRFHNNNAIEILAADDYETTLEQQGTIIPNFDKRKEMIREEAIKLATSCNGKVYIEEELLNEVTGLVEYPVPLLGSFEESLLAVPKEALISSMQTHQRCFPVTDDAGKLLTKFILVSNIKSTNPYKIIRGNELVVGARLKDAAFLFELDQKKPFINNLEKLKSVVFQEQLGSLYDKILRIEKLSAYIAEKIGAHVTHTTQAAKLCKLDLVSHMVYEFPELQGIMGYYYAQHDGEPEAVASAISDHYRPKFAQDNLPLSLPGVCVAIADRVDSLVGLFAVNIMPTSDKDPFGLRRQALAILRILIEKDLSLDLHELLNESYSNYNNKINNKGSITRLMDFFFDRLKFWYINAGGTAKTFEAVLAKKPTCPLDFYKRLKAVQDFQELPEAESLASANKRVQNLLTQASTETNLNFADVDEALLTEAAEQKLFQLLQNKTQEITPLLKKAEYTHILRLLASLKEPIDNFFNDVMVMVEDQNIKNNRLTLLQQLRLLFLEVADISLL